MGKRRGRNGKKFIYILFNRMKTENQIRKQLPLTKVKGIHKGEVKENI